MSRINLKPFRNAIERLYSHSGARSTQGAIADVFGVSTTTINKRMKTWDIERRGTGAGYLVRHDALDKIGPNEAYWLGMISADGFVWSRKNRQDKLGLGMAEKEKDAVFNFRNMLSPDQPVRGELRGKRKDGSYYRASVLQIYSQRLVDRLLELGLGPAKTHSVVPHETMVNCVYFWRGIFDGDGCFTTNNSGKYPSVKLKMGSENMIIAARDFFRKFGIGNGNICHHTYDNPNWNDTWKVSFSGQDAVDVAMLLYGDGTQPLRTDWTFRKLHRARVMATMRPDLYEIRTFYDVWDEHANALDFPHYRNGITERFGDQVLEDRADREQFETEQAPPAQPKQLNLFADA